MSNRDPDFFQIPHISSPPDKIIAWRGENPVFNHEFQKNIEAWQDLLENTAGRKFALYLKDSLEFACALFGAWLAGKVIYLPGNILDNTCEDLSNIVDGYLGEFPSQWSPLMPAQSFTFSPCGRRWREAPDEGLGELVIYTSGSTGKPKAIPKKFSQLSAEIANLEKLFGNLIGLETEIIATISHEHIYGLLFKILWPLMTGRVVHINSALFLEELVPILSTRHCTLVSTPAHLKRFPENINLTKYSKNIRAIFSSAASLSINTVHKINNILGQIPIEIYGSTETGGIAWRQRNENSDESWQPLPNIKWRISTKNNLLEISSPHLQDSDWFQTDDHIAVIDSKNNKNNNFILQSRSDNIVKLEGKRISLDAIEQAILKLYSLLISEVKILKIESEHQREYIAAFVVLTSEGHDLLNKLGKYKFNQYLNHNLSQSIERIALPRRWRYLDTLPVNSQGKILREDLIALIKNSSRPTMPDCHILEQDPKRILLELIIPSDLLYFQGHFPETPILPGVVQIHWAIIFARQYFNLNLLFRGIQKLKFQKIIQPNMNVNLELNYHAEKFILTFNLYSKLGQHASGSILFGN